MEKAVLKRKVKHEDVEEFLEFVLDDLKNKRVRRAA